MSPDFGTEEEAMEAAQKMLEHQVKKAMMAGQKMISNMAKDKNSTTKPIFGKTKENQSTEQGEKEQKANNISSPTNPPNNHNHESMEWSGNSNTGSQK